MSYAPTHQRSRQVSDGIVKGVHFLMKKNKITEIDGWGTITSPTAMTVAGDDGESEVTFDNLIIADRKSTRLNSSHVAISYAVFCLKKKKNEQETAHET